MSFIHYVANAILGSFFARQLRRQIQAGSAKAVRGYVGVVVKARAAAMTMFGMALVASGLAAGLGLAVAGVIWTIAVAPEWPQITMTSIGAFLLIVSGGLALAFFSERRWLEMSGANAMIEAVIRQNELPAIAEMAAAGVAARVADFATKPLAKAAARSGKESEALLYKQPRQPEKQPRQPEARGARDLEAAAFARQATVG